MTYFTPPWKRRRMLPAEIVWQIQRDISRPFTNASLIIAEVKKRLIPVDDEFLEDLANSERAPSFEEWMHNRLILETLLKLMDADTRRICQWRLEGYSELQIAKRLGINRSAVSVRFAVGFKEAAKELLRGKRGSKRK